ncbi:MAG: hypothetical protein Q8O09_00030, partial [Bacillota bacterium]|nr:hypothetical protein [Bacillota bacterium]
MRKAGRRILAIIISIFISIVFAGCTSGQTDATGSPSPSPAPMPSENSLAGFPPEEYVSRDGFNMTCGILITDGVKAYYRCDGGASEEWEIREADLATGKVITLAASSAFQDESGAANLFLDGGKLYFTVVNSNGDMKT